MGYIDQIILSTNEDPTYFQFWKTIAITYRKMFPKVNVHIAFLTWRDDDDPIVQDMKDYCRVTLFQPVGDVPEFAQAKMARFLCASQQTNDVCYIDDIDLFPLSKTFITDKLEKRPPGHLLCVGGEVYDNNGCYPVSQMTAEGYVWKSFINPTDKSYLELMDEWKGSWKFDRREDVCIKLDWAKDDYFSDERLLRRLIDLNPIKKIELPRGYDNYLESTIDRHTWNKVTEYWEFDRQKLINGGYYYAHGLRPFNKFASHYKPLIEYITANY